MDLNILKVEIKNFQGITSKVVEFNGRSAMIVGKNGASKSNFLNALRSPLGYAPLKPLKDGTERGSVKLTLGGEEKQFTVEMNFNEKDQKGKVTLVDSETGKVPIASTKQVLKSLIGDISFDIFKFLDLGTTPSGNPSVEGAKKQVELIKELMDMDSLNELVKIETETESHKLLKKNLTSQKNDLEGKLKNHGYSAEEVDKYAKVVDTAPIQEKFEKLSDDLLIHQEASNVVSQFALREKNCRDDIAELESQLAQKKRFLANLITEHNKAVKVVATDKPSIDAIQKELNDANEHNAHVSSIDALKGEQDQLRVMKEDLGQYPTLFKKLAEKRREVFSGGSFPIPGLTFEDDMLLWQGLPMNEEHVPKSHLISIGVKIGQLLNPNLKVLLIRDGSLLGKGITKNLLKMCEDEGYQLFIEVVDPEDEKTLEIEFVEK